MLKAVRFVLFLAFLLVFSPFTAGAEVTQNQLLFDTDELPGQNFGAAIDIDGTPELGTWAVIGEPGDTVDEKAFAGSASMWAYATMGGGTGTWLNFGKLVADFPAASARVGSPVAISGDVVALGAPSWSTNGYGAVYVYRYSEDTLFWEFEQRLTPTLNMTSQSNAGVVALDGDVIVISAFYTFPAATFVYRYNHDSSIWEKEQDLPVGGNTRGVQIAVSGDVIATKPNLLGTLKLFRYSEGTWTEEDDLGSTGNFSLHGDRLLVGDFGDDVNGENAGAASIYRFDGDSWVVEQTIRASDGAAGDGFGGYVRLIEARALIVSWHDLEDARSAYVFDYDGSSWIETEKLVASDGMAGDQFGVGMAVSSDAAVIGAYSYTRVEDRDGVAYAYNVVPEPGRAVLALAALGTLVGIRRLTAREAA
jgi:hypothetical protein